MSIHFFSSMRIFWLVVSIFVIFVSFSGIASMQVSKDSRYVYDNKGQLRAVLGTSGEVSVYEYDLAGNLMRINKSTSGEKKIISFYPKEGMAGDQVTLIGTGFGEKIEDNQISFSSGVTGKILSVSGMELVVEVPTEARSGVITLDVSGRRLITDEVFNVVAPIQIKPEMAVIDFGERMYFRASVRAADKSVNWSVEGGVGAIFGSGAYTAPKFFSGVQPSSIPVKIRATSVATPTLYAEVPVIVGRIKIEPSEAVVQPGESKQFRAEVSAVGTNNPNVVWKVNRIVGGNSVVGTINGNGEYKAPTAIPNSEIVISASSAAFKELTGQIRVRLGTIQLFPVEPIVGVGEQLQFTVTLPSELRGEEIKWSVNGTEGGSSGFGTISSSGIYTAPQSIVNDLIVVRAASAQFPSLYGEVKVRMGSVRLTASPSTFVDIKEGSDPTNLRTVVSVSPEIKQELVWSINGVEGGNETLGKVVIETGSRVGVFYKSPSKVPSVPIKVRAALKSIPTVFGEVVLKLGDMKIAPENIILGKGQSKQFSAEVDLRLGNKQVLWRVGGVVGGNSTYGFINNEGMYFSPNEPSQAIVTISAVSAVERELMRFTQVRLIGRIRITPETIALVPTQQFQFKAIVEPPRVDRDEVIWSVNEVVGGNTAVGTITSEGLYIAPAAVPGMQVKIRATCKEAPSIYGEAIVNFAGATVVVEPGYALIDPYDPKKVQFRSQVLPPETSQQVEWSVNGMVGGNDEFGKISTSGLYTPPADLLRGLINPIKIRATSVAVPGVYGDAEVEIYYRGGALTGEKR